MIRDHLADALRAALTEAGVEPPAEIHLERPARREHGDWSSNVALATAKKAGRNPRELAGELAERLNADPPAARRPASRSPGPASSTSACADTWLHDVLRRRRRRRASTATPASTSARGTKVKVEFVSRQPDRPAPRRPRPRRRLRRLAGPAARARAATTSHREFYLNDRGVADAAVRRVAARPARPASRCPRAATRASTSSSGPPRCPTTPTRSSGARQRAIADHREDARPHERPLRHVVQRARRWSTRAPSTQTLADLRARGVVYEADGAVVAAHAPTSATTRTASSSRPTASSPTCCPTSPTTATSSPAGFDLLIDVWGADHHGYVAADEGGHRRRSATTPTSSRSSITQLVELLQRRRGGEALEAHRRHHRAARRARRGRRRRGPPHLPAAVDRHAADLRPRRGHEPGDGEPGLLRADGPRPDPLDRAGGGRARASSAAPLADVDLGAARPRARARRAARRCPSCPRWWPLAAADRAPHKITTWVRELAGAVPRLLPRLLRDGRRRRRPS